MYTAHFGLAEPPFSMTPDPRYLYMSERHREALAHLLYGIGEGGGFVQLTGEVGTGKTTLCRCLLEQLPPRSRRGAHLEPQANRRRALGHGVRRAPHHVSDGDDQSQAAGRRTLPVPAGRAWPRATDRAHHRRSAGPGARGAGAGPAPHEPRDLDPEVAADHPDRPAGVDPLARTGRFAPAGPAGRGPLSPRALRGGGHAGLYPTPDGDRGSKGQD